VGAPLVGSTGDWKVDQPGPHARPGARIWGVVPAALNGAANPHRPSASEFAGSSFASGSNLSYHGGPVMLTNTTYAIYWQPSANAYDANYSSLINRYFGDVAAASGATNNVYSTDVQYYQGTSQTHITYSSSFTDSFTDTATAIPDHCSAESAYGIYGVHVTGCVTDADLQAEVSRAIQVKGWTPGPTAEFFVFTPRNVGSCIDQPGNPYGTCSYSYYCAYHSNFTDSSGRDVIYGNMPYPDTSGVGAAGVCDSGQQPNGDWADEAINLISHEHNESITDPHGDAWYDSSGNEDGDKCAWNFGSPLGSTSHGAYNQVINGNDYYVQQEWSNASSGCALGYAAPVAPTVSGFTPLSGVTGTSVTITGTGFSGANAVTINGVKANFNIISPTQISAVVPTAATSGPASVTTSGGTATSASSFTVQPAITGFSPTSGPVGTQVTITGSGFAGATGVTFGGTSAAYSVVSPTSITATAPAGGTVAVTTPAGTATGGSFTVSLAPSFTLSVTPGSRTVSRGVSTSYQVTVNPVNGFSGSVQLKVSGLPGSTSASFSPNPVAAGGSSTLTVNTRRQTPRGNYTLTVTGTSGSLTTSQQVTLTVQ
jgi:hypothetical protein